MSTLFQSCNDRCKCIFIHVPKVAGISIEETLFDEKVGHHTAIEYKREDEGRYNSYYKFAFVRNPYDRLRSAYYFLKGGGRNEFDRQWAKDNLDETGNLKEFIFRLDDDEYRKRIMNGIHFRLQYQFICEKDEVIIDFVGRYEQINNDFLTVAKNLGVDAKLPVKNVTNYDLMEDCVYNEDMRKIVHRIYEKDFNILGYVA